MQVKDILRENDRKVLTIEPGRTVHEAICKLNEHRVGALLVVEEGGEVRGIITERDILRQCAENCVRLKAPAKGVSDCPSLVEDSMTKELIIGVPDDSLDYVMGIMTKNRIRHLPILDDQKLVGIVSIGDVVNAHLKETGFENRMLKDYIHGRVF